ncbi:hypothetical protein GW17_00057197, partial [Ensete ventricosum]
MPAITFRLLKTVDLVFCSFLGCKAALDLFHFLGSDLEGLGEDMVGHRRTIRKESGGDGLGAGELAVEGRDAGGRNRTAVLLEVGLAPPGKDEDVALGDGLGHQLVGGGEEADVEDEDDLGGEVDAREGHAEGVEPGDHLLDGGSGHEVARGGGAGH